MESLQHAESSVENKSAAQEENLFRLMRLVQETQCEMEVVKPVLDELEVMRLCCSFGMMSSVNAKDFKYSALHAREFDDDFVRFLRFELLKNSCPGYVNIKGFFGKQAQVSEALADMKACSKETLSSLTEANEGIYCVKVIADQSEVQGNGDEKSSLMVFSWIRDAQFEPQWLRNTPAFVLRFLTGLTPDIICCTSPSDMEQIKTAMASSNDQTDDRLSSYSVSFHIEKQEDQPDSTQCVAVSSIDLEHIPNDCSKICLVKGSYPAIAIPRTMSSAIRTVSGRHTFHVQGSFPKWLKAKSKHFRIDLSHGIVRSVKLAQNILKEFEMWPEDEVNACRDAQEKKQKEDFDVAAMQLKTELAEKKTVVDKVSNELFRLRVDGTSNAESDAASQTAFAAYEAFREWLKSTCSWKINRKIELSLDAPTRFQEIMVVLFELYSPGHEGELSKMIEMCATNSKAEILKAIKQRNTVKESSDSKKVVKDGEGQKAMWQLFLESTAGPLDKLRTKWWLALESVLAAISEERLKHLKSAQKHAKTAWYDDHKVVIASKFDELRKALLLRDGLLLSVSAHTRGKETVICDETKEVHAPPTAYHDIVKLNAQERKSADSRQEYLGRLLLEPNTNHVAIFTVKVRSAVHIFTGSERMAVKLIYFPVITNARRPPRANEKMIRTFGKFASVCDYDARNRVLTFLSTDSVGIYKFDESFKHLDRMKHIDLDVRSTLTDLPFTDVLLLDSTVYVTDSSGRSQGIDMHNDQTSSVMSVHADTEVDVPHSRLLELADHLAVGIVSCAPSDDGAFEGNLECNARDDHRTLPILPFGVKFLTNRVSAQCVDDKVLVLDPLAQKVYVFSIRVTVRSDSYRMRQSDTTGSKSDDPESSNTDCPRKQHWMYTFYHVFEKFPVRSSLDCSSPTLVSLLIACPGIENTTTALESCHDFLSLLMSDLMELNKPLYGLDLTKDLAVERSLLGVAFKSKSLKSFFQTLITFLPVQICRAEGNAITMLHDGVDQSLDELDVDVQAWGAADIAESIRFGLLSPLLCAWRGRCVVITSMGKQSTGKSYFLNHLTGSSFAIAGNRCTDGAWMTLRIMQDVLLVVLDFEGLGSFERTDQEDVFLSVLNASVSMFTIFRMEMRFDKDIDGLFTKFQKGINLLKNDERLFQGTLYMSIKDVNPNDRQGVLGEFRCKFQKLLTANREQNFITEMYSGNLGINCSPPLGTLGYYESLHHARQLIEKLVKDSESLRGFKSGSSFHDCIRLVLAKISILDWTAVDKSSQQLEMNELHRKLPGAIRTGCLIPLEAQTKDENLPQCLKDPLLHDASVVSMLALKELSRDYPELSESWANADQEVTLDEINDEDIDFGPSCLQSC
ncbi:unnamed protein product [Peronospora destructor]|uniref:VLIG-type G domain-containing protein n=1 Tax=Peronospora destructor TaxID=86335 RepID=A0AAV0VDX3_9STRA|nr:unnamed protein product [Peronospora destructor]